MKQLYLALLLLFSFTANAQITINVDASQGKHPISPWIYGKNNNLSDDSSDPLADSAWQVYRDAGLRMFRENGGNNATKYNWRLKLSSHPDWYNNVAAHNWDYSASSLLSHTSNTQGLYALQLLGKAAYTTAHNFDDWDYNNSVWWPGVSNNWAGGGGPSTGSGNPNLYLENWTADSTTGILDHWFKDLHLDSTRLRYWNMDNEPEVWQSTHDDVASSAITAEDYMQKYFAVAKAARAKFPGIKITGPVSTNEWQWYTWNNTKVHDPNDGNDYPWMEYFIKRVAEEQKATGIKLLDVLDFHYYLNQPDPDPALVLQLHRLWFDTQWNYPAANGIKSTSPNGWDDNLTKEYIFERCNQWLNQYMGTNHKVNFGISEYGAIADYGSEDPNIIACWYASHLGTFANHGVELFTPWDWYKGQWETLHLFSNHFGQVSAYAQSNNDSIVSGYASLSRNSDSLIIAIVNRDQAGSKNVTLNIQNFDAATQSVQGYQLANLPGSTETFISKTNNALKPVTYALNGNSLSLSVPKLSVTLVKIPSKTAIATGVLKDDSPSLAVYPNPVKDKLYIDMGNDGKYSVEIKDLIGKTLGKWNYEGDAAIEMSEFVNGSYILQITKNDQQMIRKIVKD